MHFTLLGCHLKDSFGKEPFTKRKRPQSQTGDSYLSAFFSFSTRLLHLYLCVILSNRTRLKVHYKPKPLRLIGKSSLETQPYSHQMWKKPKLKCSATQDPSLSRKWRLPHQPPLRTLLPLSNTLPIPDFSCFSLRSKAALTAPQDERKGITGDNFFIHQFGPTNSDPPVLQ